MRWNWSRMTNLIYDTNLQKEIILIVKTFIKKFTFINTWAYRSYTLYELFEKLNSTCKNFFFGAKISYEVLSAHGEKNKFQKSNAFAVVLKQDSRVIFIPIEVCYSDGSRETNEMSLHALKEKTESFWPKNLSHWRS